VLFSVRGFLTASAAAASRTRFDSPLRRRHPASQAPSGSLLLAPTKPPPRPRHQALGAKTATAAAAAMASTIPTVAATGRGDSRGAPS
jgi:hypothetical protein